MSTTEKNKPLFNTLSLNGIRIDALTQDGLIEVLQCIHLSGERWLFLNHNLHSLYLFSRDASFRAAYSLASLIYIDGLPVIWLGKAAGLPLNTTHRITLLDCFEAVLHQAMCRQWRVFYLGSTQQVMVRALAILRTRFPELNIEGRNGFFSEEESTDVIDQINGWRPDILFVGMGMPRQELWLYGHLSKLNSSAIITSGATLDYVTGDAYRPPAWVGSLGLYGIWRLFSDPVRLWRRYLVEPGCVALDLGGGIIRQRLRKQSTKTKL